MALRPFVLVDPPKLFVMSIEERMRRWIPDEVYRDEQHAEQVVRALVRVFEIDRPDTQAWKQRRLAELGLPPTSSLQFVPVDFEAGEAWWPRLAAAGFDVARPAIVASAGVSMYLEHDTNAATFRQLATALAPGSTFVVTFMIPIDLVADPEEQTIRQFAERGARSSGTPFISFYPPDEIVATARVAGFREVRHVSPDEIVARYFAERTDGLRPATSEQLLLATV